MIIQTKFNVGDTVFVFSNNKVIQSKILKIDADVKLRPNTTHIDISYTLQDTESINFYDFNISRKESEVFETKEELIKSL